MNKAQQQSDESIEIPVGKHQLVARLVRPKKETAEARLRVDLTPGETRQLHVVMGKRFGSPLTLSLD